MDSRFFGHSRVANSSELSSYPTRLVGSLKVEPSTISPDSPFSTYSDASPLTPYSRTIEHQQQRSVDNNTSSTSSLGYQQQHHFRHGNINNDPQRMRHALQELETALMSNSDDEDNKEATNSDDPFLGERRRQPQTPSQSSRSWSQTQEGGGQGSSSHSPVDTQADKTVEKNSPLQAVPPDNLKQLLVACARALSENDLQEFGRLEKLARASVSVTGEPIQRLGAYMIEGLVARKHHSGTNIYRALKCNEPEGKALLSYMHILYEVCPYLKFGYMAANGAIAEACKNEDRIHIVDFQIAQGTQWLTLLQALAARPGGPPHVRITGIDDPLSKYARGAGLAAIEARLAAISSKFKIPVEFHAVPVYAPDVTKEMLDVRPNEALAVNFPLQLHHTPDESVDVSNPRDRLLRMVRSMNPKVVTLIEQESNANTTPFLPRFVEALDYYSAMFESMDVTMARDRKERVSVEEQCLARDVVNIIACEGKDRVERHELLGKWRLRFAMAGFRSFPLSSYVNSVIRGLLMSYSESYRLVEKDGAMLLGWKARNLVSASAWH